MTLTQLAVAALATWEAVEVWRHGSIFAGWRARTECWSGRVGGFLSQLLHCPFCLSVWVAAAVTAMTTVATLLPLVGRALEDMAARSEGPAPVWVLLLLAAVLPVAGSLIQLVIAALAVARLANLGNDLTHARCRTPRPNSHELDETP